MTIAQQVRELRKQKGWSQEDLASQAQVRRATIIDIESGRSRPRISTLEKIAAVLGAEVRLVKRKRP